MKRFNRICVAAALVCGMATSAPAQTLGEATRAEALAGAIAGSDDGRKAIERYLDGGGLPEVAAQRAATLIRELRRGDLVADPLVLQAAADRIASAASRSFISAQIFRAQVMPGFDIGTGRLGFDFGPPDSDVQPGFVKVTARSEMVKGPQPAAMRRPEGEALSRDGIRNLRQIRLPVPPGNYRVFLMTDDIGVPQATTNPFGTAMKINGQRVRVAAATPQTWAADTYLAEPGRYLADPAAAAEVARRGAAKSATSAGIVMMRAEVQDGFLVITFDGDAGLETYLTGLILEPDDSEESIFAPSEEARRALFTTPERILEAENVVNEAVAQLLNDVVTEANPQQLASLLDQSSPVVEPSGDVSPN